MSITVNRHKDVPHLDPSVRIKPIRRDGKHPVTYYFPGAPNMFGGRDHGKTFNKLHTASQINTAIGHGYNVDDESNGTFIREVPDNA